MYSNVIQTFQAFIYWTNAWLVQDTRIEIYKSATAGPKLRRWYPKEGFTLQCEAEFIIISIVLCVNLYTSFVFRNGPSFLQPGVILSTGGIIFSILNQAVGKTIVNTFSDCKIVLDAVQLHPNAHAGYRKRNKLFQISILLCEVCLFQGQL